MHRHALIAAGLGLLLTGATRADDIELYVGAAQAQTPENYPNVLLVIDTSGSMNDRTDSGQTRIEVVKQVANELLDTLDHVNVGLMRFSTGYTENHVLHEGGGMVLHALEDIATSRDAGSIRSSPTLIRPRSRRPRARLRTAAIRAASSG